MTNWNVHGWERLSGDKPEVVATRNEVLRQLRYVPESHRSKWKSRLTSKQDHPYLSVILEIYLYQLFRGHGWDIEIEPELPDTTNRPDYGLSKGKCKMIVEAKSVLGTESERQQDSRLMKLADDLRGKLDRTVLIHPYIDLPPSLPNRRIAAEIKKKASKTELSQEFRIEGEHEGFPYALEVTVLLEDKPIQTADVGAAIGQAYHVSPGQSVRKAIQDKAHKYGEIDIPFMVMVWPIVEYHFSEDDDLMSLYGDPVVSSGDGPPRLEYKSNGIFNIMRENGTHRYSNISAVGVCHVGKTDSLRIYHNPFAKHSVGIDVFKGIPQHKFDLTTGMGQWIAGDQPEGAGSSGHGVTNLVSQID